MNRIKKILMSILMMALLVACSDVAKDYMEKYDLGMRYLTEGNYEEAVLAFTAAIEIDDKLPDAYIGRGDAYIMWAESVSDVAEEKIELALADFLKAIDLDKKNADTYLKAADIYISDGDLEAAKTLLEKGVKATGDERLKGMLQDLEIRLADGFLRRPNYVDYTTISDDDRKFINQLVSCVENHEKESITSMLLQDKYSELIDHYSISNVLLTQNDKYKIELYYDRYDIDPSIEIHPVEGKGYKYSYSDVYGDVYSTYLVGSCSEWNWNGSFEVTREYIAREEDGWGIPISEKGTAVNGLVHGDYEEKRVRGTEIMIDDIKYDMGVEISHVDNISGEWPVENDGYLKTPSSSVPDDDVTWWDWNA